MKIKNLVKIALLSLFLCSCGAMAKTYRYISIDSGGMLGTIPAHLLNDIEVQTGRQVYELVDGMIGTSTGAIISAMLLVPAPNSDLPYTSQEVIDFYSLKGKSIFEEATASAIKNAIAAFQGRRPDFSGPSGLLKKHAEEAFASRRLSEAKARLMILSFDKNFQTRHLFDSGSFHSHEGLPLSSVVCASSFVANIFGDIELVLDGQVSKFIDPGSIGIQSPINNPTAELVAALESQANPEDEYVIYSLGTGFQVTQPFKSKDSNIRVVRIEPDIRELTGGKDGVMVKNLVSASTSEFALQAMSRSAEALMKTHQYAQMLEDFRGRAKKDEL